MHDRHVIMQNALLVAQHFRPSRGFLCTIIDFILVLKLFLDSHVEAIFAKGLILRNLVFSLFFATSIFATPLVLFA